MVIKPKTNKAALEIMLERIDKAAEDGQLAFRGGDDAEMWIITVKAVRNAMLDALAYHRLIAELKELRKSGVPSGEVP